MTSKNRERLTHIARLVGEKGFLSVLELSRSLQVSEMTIRRDLDKLVAAGRIQRIFGGAASLRTSLQAEEEVGISEPGDVSKGSLAGCQAADVLVAASLDPRQSMIIQDISAKRGIPFISESLPHPKAMTCVSKDDYAAGMAIGRWAGAYAVEHWAGQANVLDLTYHLFNTQERSRGFLDGLRQALPAPPEVLTLNPQTLSDMAYQLTSDALTVNSQINIIFAVNDTIAWGAINACRDLHLDPDRLVVIPFGLEGERLKDALAEGFYCKAGLAMFPEVVGPECIEAAIGVFNHLVLPERMNSPYAVLTKENLNEFYVRNKEGWQLRWEAVRSQLGQEFDYETAQPHPGSHLPRCIGIILPFSEHEWYQKLVGNMQTYSRQLEINVEIVDVEQTLKDEVESRRREIARCASEAVHPDEVIFIDGGPLAQYLAERLGEREQITVITHSLPVFDLLKNNPNITLILTGGVLRRNSQALVGPMAENAVRDLRADKLFLTATGVSVNFGLSHTTVSEVTMKQAMIRSAREVILLADYTCFGQESVAQIAPLSAVHKIIADDALAASTRLQLSQLGIKVVIARV